MDIDERLQFLVQSTESLHQSCQELHATTAEHTQQIAALIQLATSNERRWSRVMRVLRDALDAGLNHDDGDVP